MASINLPTDFKEFLRLLNTHHVEYLIVGGYAVAYHGYPRATADLDVWVAVERRNSERLTAALRAFGFDLPALTPELFLEPGRVVRMGVPPLRIKILTSISGVNFDECYRDRIIDVLDEVQVNLLDSAHLKLNKRAAGRHRDLDDLDNLP